MQTYTSLEKKHVPIVNLSAKCRRTEVLVEAVFIYHRPAGGWTAWHKQAEEGHISGRGVSTCLCFLCHANLRTQRLTSNPITYFSYR